MAAHRVIFGGGAQTLYHAPQRDAAPIVATSATYRIVDLTRTEDDAAYEVVAAGTAATISSVSTTITAAAGRRASDPSVLTVASATGISAGRTYLLRTTTLASELVEVEYISGTTLYLARPVKGNYASGSSFLGVEAEATFPLAQANDEEDYDAGRTVFAIDWTYDGRTLRELIYVVRVASSCPVTEQALDAYVPELSTILGSTRDAGDYISAAWKFVKMTLRRHGLDPDEMATDDALQAAVCYRAAVKVFSRQNDEASTVARDGYQEDYDAAISGLTHGLQAVGVERIDRDGATRQMAERRGIVRRR